MPAAEAIPVMTCAEERHIFVPGRDIFRIYIQSLLILTKQEDFTA
jgi:hypothetical protein